MDLNENIIFPAPLSPGDKIAIVSPAGAVDEYKVTGAAAELRGQGWEPVIYPHALGRNGQFSGTAQERLADITAAFRDPEIKAILCSRGGYGVVHLLDELDDLDLRGDPKWVIGFSDISALHGLMASQGVASIHAPMASQIMKGTKDPDTKMLFDILRGERPAYIFPRHEYDKPGVAIGRLYGGNLAVLSELVSTPYDILKPGTILFIEDVAEPVYKVERMLYQLRLNGVLKNVKGIIVGKFTEYKPDHNYDNMYDMIRDALSDVNVPVAFDVPVGHVDHNLPLIEGATVTLKVSPEGNNSIIFHK